MKTPVILTVVALGLLVAVPGFATPPVPSSGSATVDGDPGEWNLATDHFADMYRAGKVTKPLESKLYLRYDCTTGTLFALILAEAGIPALTDSSTTWIAIDSQSNKVVTGFTGNDGIPADIALVDQAFDGDWTHARGYEASFLLPEGNYEIIAHVDVFDDGRAQTSATPGFPGSGAELEIDCGTVPTERVSWSRIKQLAR